MFRVALLTALPALIIAAPALAQDTPSQFSGPRVEVTVGLDQLRFNLAQLGSTGRGRISDLGYGLAVGYDAALTPTLVAGLEGGIDYADGTVTTGDSVDGDTLKRRRELTLAGRIGTSVTPNTLLYAKLGYANLQLRQELTVASVESSSKENLSGVLAGVGAEVKISPSAYLKSEYRYTNYRDGYSSNQVMTGLGLRF